MKGRFFILQVLILLTFFSNAQFVRLEGRRFMLEGKPFYPVMMDYFLAVVYQKPASCDSASFSPSGIFPAQGLTYGPTFGSDCNDPVFCREVLLKDFAMIRKLGFNSIRITSGPHWHPDDRMLKLEASCSEPQYYGKCGNTAIPFEKPYRSNAAVNAYFSLLDSVVAYAGRCGLRVMLDIVLFNDNLRFDSGMLRDTYKYLRAFGKHFRENPGVFAYCIFEEIGYNDPLRERSKSEVGEISAKLYWTLKKADPNHLISISGFDIFDLDRWDVGLMKLDFYQAHMYPEIHKIPPPFRDAKMAQNRMAGRLHWLATNCPVPFMIGETGFMANDYNIGKEYEKLMDGTENEQLEFAGFFVEKALECKASGIGWFMYQDGWSNLGMHKDYPDGYGLLKKGRIPDTATLLSRIPFKKPIATFFAGLKLPEPDTNRCREKTAFYYDPFNTAYYNPDMKGSVSGFVTGPDGKPLADAVVLGWNWLSTLPGRMGNQYKYSLLYTFTDERGYFRIGPFNYTAPGDNRLVHVQVTARNHEVFHVGGFDDTPLPAALGSIRLKKVLVP